MTITNCGHSVEEIERRITALARTNGIGNEVTVRWVEPWSLRPGGRPEHKPTRAPATPPVVIEPEHERVIRAVLAVHYRHGAPWDRAWRSALRAVRRQALDSEPDWRTAYLNGGPEHR